ncbi:MAG TPA: hypothetical protein VII11_05130 [Bacteroidota bacterium]
MSIFGDIRMYARFTAGLPAFLKKKITLEEAIATIRKRIEEREANFLRIAKKGIYGYPQSPYVPLLKMAGCEYGDLEQSVRSKGLEPTLHKLKSEGVYVGFEEFKGRKPMVRGGQTFHVEPHNFDNPHLRQYYYTETGGSTGVGTRVATDLERLADRAPTRIFQEYAHGIFDAPTAVWSPILPGGGFNGMIGSARVGHVPVKWFSPITREDLEPSFKYRAATWYLITVARVLGVPIPSPETVRLNEANKIARWIASTLKQHRKCRLSSYVSLGVRVAIAAAEEGLDLTGAVFTGAGEPPTPAKIRHIRQVGARWVPGYAVSEAGGVGHGCVHPIDENDNHFMKDSLALIEAPTVVTGTDMTVNGFYLTSLLASSPTILLNFESHDYGIIEERKCGCAYEELGFTQHIREIRSVSKLTGEGMTLIGSDLVRILEEVLPSRFGGSAQDYQLAEEEDTQGLTKLSLTVSPRVPLHNEQEAIDIILAALPNGGPGSDLGRAMWSQAKTIRVKRAEPVWTGRGKLMPLHLDRTIKRIRTT